MVNWRKSVVLIVATHMLGLLVACQTRQVLPSGETIMPDVEPTLAEPAAAPATEPIVALEPTAASATESIVALEPAAAPTTEQIATAEPALFSLPERSGPRTETSGRVPHVQIGVEPVTAVNEELYRRTFALPGVEEHPTIVSLPGAIGMWLSDDLAVAHPEAIVNGREFAHIHPDGSLHAPLPYERALEVAEKGWGERHPWADDREGWDGFVMLYTPQSMEELEITFQLIVESYNHVTGQAVQASDFE